MLVLGAPGAAEVGPSSVTPDVASRARGEVTAWVVSPRLLVAQAVTAALVSAGSDVELHAWEVLRSDVATGGRSDRPRHVVVVFDEADLARVVDEVKALVRAGDVRVAIVAPDPGSTMWAALLEEPEVDVIVTARTLSDLAEAVERFAAGDRLLPPDRRQALREAWEEAIADRRQVVAMVATLSPQQRRVLELLAAGHRVSEVASQMGLADGTVRSHVKTLRAKLGARTQIEAVAMLRTSDVSTPGQPG